MKYTCKLLLVILATMSWTLSADAALMLQSEDTELGIFDEEEGEEEEDEEDEDSDGVVVSTIAIDEEDLPEGMQDREFDMLYRDWAVKNLVNSSEGCDPSSENPEYSKEEYIQRLSRMQTVIEMPYNDIVRSFIDRYTNNRRRAVSVMLGAGNFYMPIFEEALESYQVPLELKYLPVIESALNPAATSRVGAAGLWQFMIGTGKKYGLEVTSLIDERRDPVKASFAAAHFLKDLYTMFGDWTLCVAAYNCGPGNVNKAIKRAGGSKDFWTIYPYLPRETRGYVPAFIAANYVMNYYCDHNICPAETRLPMDADTIIINRDLHFDQIIKATGIDTEELQSLNPQYRTRLIPGASHQCILRMPSEAVGKFLEAGDSIYNYHDSELFTKRKEVPMGDSDAVQAVTSDKSSSASKKADRRSRKENSRNSRDRKNSRKEKKSRASSSYSVKAGDTLYDLANRNGTTVEKIKKANGIKSDVIQPGQKLKLK